MTEHDDDTDDGMSAEEMMLGATEESLREELDMASEVGELLLSPSRIKGAGEPDDDDPPFLDLDDDGGQAEVEGSLLISAIFCLLGVGTLLPWNAFISSEPYFHARLCSLFGDGGGIELLFGLCFNVCGFLSLVVVIVAATKRADTQSSASGARESRHVLWALGLYLSLFLITKGAVLVPNLDPTLFLVATLLSLSVFGSCLAVAGTNIVGIASLFPPQIAIAPFFAGQATGGAFISLTNFISATAESPNSFWDEHCRHSNSAASHFTVDDNECPSYQRDIPTFWYFLLGSVILVLCIIGFVVLDRLAITQYYRRLASGEQNATNDLTQPLLESPPQHPSASTNDEELLSDESSIQSVLKAIKFPALAIFLTAFVTLSLFPAYTSTMQSVSMCKATNRLQNDLFEPLGFILFNFPDLLARIIAPICIDIQSVQSRPEVLFRAAASRLIFPGLFLFAKSSSTGLPYINSDLYSISVSIAFAFSNGVLMSMCFMVAPLLLPQHSGETTRQRCSDFMNLSLASGLLGGSIASVIFSKVATAL